MNHEFEVNQRGTPIRFRIDNDYEADGKQPGTWEQFILKTIDVNGAEFPSEAVVTVYNPNVGPQVGIHLFELLQYEGRDDLTEESVRLDRNFRNARVRDHLPDTSTVMRVYDDDGRVIEEQLIPRLEDAAPAAGSIVSYASARARRFIPMLATAAAVASGLVLTFASRRRRPHRT